jgi:hypothetical protein
MTLTFTLEHRFSLKDHNLGRFRLSVTDSSPPLGLSGLPDSLAHLIAIPPAKRTVQQRAEITRYFRDHDAKLAELKKAVADYPKIGDKRLPGLQDLAWALLNSPEFLFNH